MITPQDVLCMKSKTADMLEERIDKLIATAATTGHWPCTLSLTGEFQPFATEVAERYRKVGWDISIDSQDPREPPFIMIQKPKRR